MVVRTAAGIVEVIDFRETAPLGASRDMYHGNATLSLVGGLAVGVPGELRGLEMAWQRHGKLPWENLFVRVATIAENGYTVTASLANALKSNENYIRANPALADIYLLDGRIAQQVRGGSQGSRAHPSRLLACALTLLTPRCCRETS